MIKPAVEAASLQCIRADEIVHSGLIDLPMYQQLLTADVVVADLSTSNKNAFYELGVRHALRPYTTVVIAEDGIKTFPFDVNHVVVRQYHHLGEDIGFEEVMRFRQELTAAIVEIMKKHPPDKDSPVYTFLGELAPPTLAAMRAAAEAPPSPGGAVRGVPQSESLAAAGPGAAAPAFAAPASGATHSMIMQLVEEAQKRGDFVEAKRLLSGVREEIKREAPDRPEDPDIVQRLALVTYKSEKPSREAALRDARALLATLDPDTSNDTETLGLWGAVHKRLWDETRGSMYLDDAIRAYERGFCLRNDYYNGINFAYLLNVRAANSADPGAAIADFVQARRVRKEVLSICDRWLGSNSAPDGQAATPEAVEKYKERRYWVLATLGEAWWGLGDETQAQKWLEEAYRDVPTPWMRKSTEEQIEKLTALLEDSPLKYLSPATSP
ncbi:MAG TPA: tetratricopeptide repeat-containing protein [Thermoanaerobaculia bacterium]|nr:tetratricopeptide repeat-containing protein [Thermoanaerobaculia bacterium]